MVHNPVFEAAVKEKIGTNVDTAELEEQIKEIQNRITLIQQEKISADNIYKLLLLFDELYGCASEVEQKQLMRAFVERIELFPERRKDGNWIKKIVFNFPIPVEGGFVKELSLESDTTIETVVLLSKGDVDSKKVRVEFSLEDMDMSEFQDGATYAQIKDYVLEHTRLNVTNLYISQVKRKCGLEVGKNYNLPKSEDHRAAPLCPPEKEEAILAALKHFGMIG